VVAQIYGVELESFYKVALMCCYLGFDGIDINMGCPANKVARRGSGAGMIRIPDHARKVVKICKKAAHDWANGITLEEADIRPKVVTALKAMRPKEGPRKELPVSVKTRIGYDKIVAEEWVQTLLEEKPANITMHGRTLKQMYSGESNWEVISKAAEKCKGTGTSFLGNGDIRSLEDALDRVKRYKLDGALVGRATGGNPWFFSGHHATLQEKFKAAAEHAAYFEKNYMDHAFFAMRKHLAWYCRGFDGAREVRSLLMQANTAAEVKEILDNAKIESVATPSIETE